MFQAPKVFKAVGGLGASKVKKLKFGCLRSLFIQTEETPNPSSLKFIPGTTLLPSSTSTNSTNAQTLSFSRSATSPNPNFSSPLATRLLRLPQVSSVLISNDFISVNKTNDVTWAQLKPQIFEELTHFFTNTNLAAVVEKENVVQAESEDGGGKNVEGNEEEDEIEGLIKELLEERIRPMVQGDGGDIWFESWDEKTGVVTVKLMGSCQGCPSAEVTLKSGVENMLKHYVPEVREVIAIPNESDEELNQRSLHFEPSV